MKPYIMNYSETIEISPVGSTFHTIDTTTKTFTIESHDNDEIRCDWTIQTNVTEPTDNDSILC